MLRSVLRALAFAARVRRRINFPGSREPTIERVVHVSPAYFHKESYVGGGERWAMSLAEAMSNDVDTSFVTFGPGRKTVTKGSLKIEIFPAYHAEPTAVHQTQINYRFLAKICGADVVHCHHFRTTVSSLAILATAACGGRTFVTDLGGSTPFFVEGVHTTPFVDGFLHISEFAGKMLPGRKSHVVYGGVPSELLRLAPVASEKKGQVLCVARLLPHKGINYLIEAMPSDVSLQLIGRAYHPDYFKLLQELARGKNVAFTTNAEDPDLWDAYRGAVVTVLPSVYRDVYGTEYAMPELLGLVLLESMACGTPVICTDVASMPEFVQNGVTGFIVPPNDPRALRERINYLLQNPGEAAEMGRRGRERILREFTWQRTAERCLAAYRSLGRNQ